MPSSGDALLTLQLDDGADDLNTTTTSSSNTDEPGRRTVTRGASGLQRTNARWDVRRGRRRKGKPRDLFLKYGVAHTRRLRDDSVVDFVPSSMEPRIVAASILELLSRQGDTAVERAKADSRRTRTGQHSTSSSSGTLAVPPSAPLSDGSIVTSADVLIALRTRFLAAGITSAVLGAPTATSQQQQQLGLDLIGQESITTRIRQLSHRALEHLSRTVVVTRTIFVQLMMDILHSPATVSYDSVAKVLSQSSHRPATGVASEPLTNMPFDTQVASLAGLFDAVDDRSCGVVAWDTLFAYLHEASVLGHVGRIMEELKVFEIEAVVSYGPHRRARAAFGTASSSAVSSKRQDILRAALVAKAKQLTGESSSSTSSVKAIGVAAAEKALSSLEYVSTENDSTGAVLAGPVVSVSEGPRRGNVLLSSTTKSCLVRVSDRHMVSRCAVDVDVYPGTADPTHLITVAHVIESEQLIALGTNDGQLLFYYTGGLTPKRVASLTPPAGNPAAMCWAHREGLLVVGCRVGTITSYTVAFRPSEGANITQVHHNRVHAEMITSVADVPLESCLLTASFDRIATVIDTKTFAVLQRLVGHRSAVMCAIHVPAINAVVTGAAFDPEPHVWAIGSGNKPPLRLTDESGVAHAAPIVALRDLPWFRSIASLDTSGVLRTWDLRFYTALQVIDLSVVLKHERIPRFVFLLVYYEGETRDYDPIPTCRLTALTQSSGCVTLVYNLTQKRVPSKNTADDEVVLYVAVIPRRRVLLTVSLSQVKSWDIMTSGLRDMFRDPSQAAASSCCAQMDPTGKLLAVGDRTGMATVMNVSSGGVVARSRCLGADPAVPQPIAAVAWLCSNSHQRESSETDDGRADNTWFVIVGIGVRVITLALPLQGVDMLSDTGTVIALDSTVRAVECSGSTGIVVVGEANGWVSILNAAVLLAPHGSRAEATMARVSIPFKPLMLRDLSATVIHDVLQVAVVADDDGQLALFTLKPPLPSASAKESLPAASDHSPGALASIIALRLGMLPRMCCLATWMLPFGRPDDATNRGRRTVMPSITAMTFGQIAGAAVQESNAVAVAVPLYVGDDQGYVTLFDLGPSFASALLLADLAAGQQPAAFSTQSLRDGAVRQEPPRWLPDIIDCFFVQPHDSQSRPQSMTNAYDANTRRVPRVINRWRAHSDAITGVVVLALEGHLYEPPSISALSSPGAPKTSSASYCDPCVGVVTSSADQCCYAWTTSGSRFLGAYDQYRRCPVQWPTLAMPRDVSPGTPPVGDAATFNAVRHEALREPPSSPPTQAAGTVEDDKALDAQALQELVPCELPSSNLYVPNTAQDADMGSTDMWRSVVGYYALPPQQSDWDDDANGARISAQPRSSVTLHRRSTVDVHEGPSRTRLGLRGTTTTTSAARAHTPLLRRSKLRVSHEEQLLSKQAQMHCPPFLPSLITPTPTEYHSRRSSYDAAVETVRHPSPSHQVEGRTLVVLGASSSGTALDHSPITDTAVSRQSPHTEPIDWGGEAPVDRRVPLEGNDRRFWSRPATPFALHEAELRDRRRRKGANKNTTSPDLQRCAVVSTLQSRPPHGHGTKTPVPRPVSVAGYRPVQRLMEASRTLMMDRLRTSFRVSPQ